MSQIPKPLAYCRPRTNGSSRVVAEYHSRTSACSICLNEASAGLAPVYLRIDAGDGLLSIPVGSLEQGFELARKIFEGGKRLTSGFRSHSGNW